MTIKPQTLEEKENINDIIVELVNDDVNRIVDRIIDFSYNTVGEYTKIWNPENSYYAAYALTRHLETGVKLYEQCGPENVNKAIKYTPVDSLFYFFKNDKDIEWLLWGFDSIRFYRSQEKAEKRIKGFINHLTRLMKRTQKEARAFMKIGAELAEKYGIEKAKDIVEQVKNEAYRRARKRWGMRIITADNIDQIRKEAKKIIKIYRLKEKPVNYFDLLMMLMKKHGYHVGERIMIQVEKILERKGA